VKAWNLKRSKPVPLKQAQLNQKEYALYLRPAVGIP
jgi:hypothetical protein